MKDKKFFLTFKMSILSAFILLLIFSSGFIVFFSYYNALATMDDVSKDLILNISNQSIEKTINHISPAMKMSFFMAHLVRDEKNLLADFELFEEMSIETMNIYPQLEAINCGFENNNFYMVKREGNKTFSTKIIRRDVALPYVEWRYRDTDNEVIKVTTHHKLVYCPTKRPWYVGTKDKKSFFMSDVYVFFTDKIPGVTIGYPMLSKDEEVLGVVSFDMSLIGISDFLKTLKIGNTGRAFLLNNKGEIIAHPDEQILSTKVNDKGAPVLNSVKSLTETSEYAAFNTFLSLNPDINGIPNKKIKYSYNNELYLAYFYSFPKDIRDNWIICIIVPENDFIGPIKRNLKINIFLTLIISFLAVLLAILLSNLITKPISRITDETSRIKHLELEHPFEPSSFIKEIFYLENNICDMKTGLKSFEKYVPSELVKQLIETGVEAKSGGARKTLTILFADIEDFTNIAERFNPEELFLYLSEYLEVASQEVIKNKGTIDKFIGDAIMSFWNAPLTDSEHAYNACKSGLSFLKRLEKAKISRKLSGKPIFNTRIGIHTGEVIVGNIGTRSRLNYTIIGDNVNLASRIESLNKYYKTNILITESTYSIVKDKFFCRFVDKVIVKGKLKSIELYEIVGEKGEDEIDERLIKLSIKAFDFYTAKNWKESESLYDEILSINEGDYIARIFIDRINKFKYSPPPKGWDGSFKYGKK
ncbi:Cache 3/Cache 2 fusion domain-containing protein [Candidatus Dependentiae bacterium]|nr:Cache 3/Cache 2 fusion domain-containing protein [Candidatus Dependentiae bacterium]